MLIFKNNKQKLQIITRFQMVKTLLKQNSDILENFTF